MSVLRMSVFGGLGGSLPRDRLRLPAGSTGIGMAIGAGVGSLAVFLDRLASMGASGVRVRGVAIEIATGAAPPPGGGGG